jgi:lipoprotein Spr
MKQRRADRIVERARALIGARFRPQGRSPERGLDCIGVVVMAAGIDTGQVRDDYGLRSSNPEELNDGFDKAGFVRIPPNVADDGDILLVRSGPAQLHVVVLTPLGYVHADASLRRVVESPGEVPWPILSAWRYPDIEELAHDYVAAGPLN